MSEKEKNFINQSTFAVMGNTRRGRYAVKGLKKLGKTVFFVDEKFSTDASKGKFADLSQVPGSVDAAIIDHPFQTGKIKSDVIAAAEAGIKTVWLNFQSAPAEAVKLARQRGMDVLHGQCVVVWLPMGGPHALHRGLWKLFGKY